MKKNILQPHIHSGFTLLEMLFAVIIFSFALVSLIGITGKGVATTVGAKDQLTAQFLAEELLEVARNTRDQNYLIRFSAAGGNPAQDWLNGLSVCEEDTPCDIDYPSDGQPVLEPCPSDPCGPLYELPGGVFTADENSGGDRSRFSRGLVIKTTTNPTSGEIDQVDATATVYWNQKALSRSYTLSTGLTDWQ